ncbi:MAG: trehalase-like domain-containing protein, partial [Nitrospirales bacterium]|nr:trehalase-like domain-containing protein [Nitrospirales bacterium]
MAYQPIENYGLIGNMRTTALVGMNGSIDWFCFPYFDSPSLFAAILDDAKGGRFKIAPIPDGVRSKQYYWPDTNVLVTRFHTPAGVGRLIDFMPVGLRPADCTQHGLVRRVQAIRGSMAFRVECRPAFNYGRDGHRVTIEEDGASFQSASMAFRLGSTIPLRQEHDAIVMEFTLQEGEEVDFCLQEIGAQVSENGIRPEAQAEELFKYTVDFWRRWLSKCTYTGRWREMVHRSALV